MPSAKELDQFFTTPEVAKECVKSLLNVLPELGYSECSFLEPSAGGGSFLEAARFFEKDVIGYDIDPKREDIYYADFLNDDLLNLPSREDLVIIGNPPFGKRSQLAVDFINRGFKYSDTIAFVLPVQFIKYLTQKRIVSGARLVYQELLAPQSFTYLDKPYSVRCVFQIWTIRDEMNDLRIRQAPATKHKDFEMFIYNCVPEALYMFDLDWDFAVHRQGWVDFTPIDKNSADNLSKKKQWMFFKSDNPEILQRLKKIDFNKLGEKNTSVKGFGKADVVEEYNKLYGDSSDEGFFDVLEEATLF